jgi:xanthine dehydrogenase accessory factor
MTAAQALRATALAWQAQGRAAVLVQVISHRGSVPRESGTRMLVAADEVAGTIGGGHLELKAIADARALLSAAPAHPTAQGPGLAPSPSRERGREPQHAPWVQRIALGPSLGQCCGGVLELAFTPLAASDLRSWPLPAPLFTLQLYGAGHVGRAIVRLLAGIDCHVQWIDEREAEFPTDPLPPHIERLCVEPVQAEVVAAPPGACYLVLTHSHDLDLAIAQAVLARNDFRYLGLIGSKTKRARFEHRLRDRGCPAATIDRMTCPIGVPGISGKEPEVIAIAVVAQLLQVASAAGSGG